MPSRSDAPFSSAAAELTTLEVACEEAAGAAEEAVEEEAEEPPQPVSTAADRMAQTARDAIFVRFIINYSFFC